MTASVSSKHAKGRRIKKNLRRTAVLVLGMHRSGTSALTRVVNLLGCDLPKTMMEATPANETGHWESVAIYKLNERILQSVGSTWRDWTEFNPGWFDSPKADEFREEAIATVIDEFGSSRLFVLKDPRNCLLLPFWLDVLTRCEVKPLALLPIRNPLEVAASLEKRNGFEPAIAHLLWLRHVLEAEAASRGLPRFFSTYDQLLHAWGGVASNAQTAVGIRWPSLSDHSAREIDTFLSRRYRHHQRLPKSVIDNPSLSVWLREAYSILNNWALSREKTNQRSQLDRIRYEFNTASPAFEQLIAAGQAARERVVRLEKSLSESTGRLSTAQASSIAIEQKSKQLEQKLAAALALHDQERERAARLEEERGALRGRIFESDEKIAALHADIARRNEEVQALERARSDTEWRLKEVEALHGYERERAARLEEERGALRRRIAESEEKAVALQAEIARRNEKMQALERVRSDTEWRLRELEALHGQERKRAARLEEELGALHGRVADDERVAATLRAELATRSEAGADARRAAIELRDRLADAQSALTQGSAEAARGGRRLIAPARRIPKGNGSL